MMIYTAKLPWKKCLMALAALLAVLVAIVVLAQRSGTEDSAATFGSKTGKNDASRVAYLTQLGWEVSPEPISQEEILIPEVLDEATYGPYLALQAEAGFDLTQYAGKTVTRYTYQVLNYPTGEEDIVAGVLVYQGQVIGGEVMSVALDGFIQSLVYPAG
jgi:hypothetical protein